MRPEGQSNVFAMKTPVRLLPRQWEERLEGAGFKEPHVGNMGRSGVDGESIVEVRIDGGGVKMTQETQRHIEEKLRRLMSGQVLQN